MQINSRDKQAEPELIREHEHGLSPFASLELAVGTGLVDFLSGKREVAFAFSSSIVQTHALASCYLYTVTLTGWENVSKLKPLDMLINHPCIVPMVH